MFIKTSYNGCKRVDTFINEWGDRVDDFLTRLVNRLTQRNLFIITFLINPTRKSNTTQSIVIPTEYKPGSFNITLNKM